MSLPLRLGAALSVLVTFCACSADVSVSFSELLEGSRAPGVLAPMISPERSINDPILIPARGSQVRPAMATDGSNFLAVWQDGYGIRAARVRPDGTLLDPDGIVISSDQYYTKSSPAVAFNGTNYLIVWQDRQNGTSYNDNIRGARLSASGVLLDTTSIGISTSAGHQRVPAVASDGTDFLVVWEDRRSGSTADVYGTIVRASGIVTSAAGIPYSTGAGEQQSVAVAYDGAKYLVTWQDSRSGGWDIYAAQVDRTGSLSSPTTGIPIVTAAGSQVLPAVAFDGTNFLLTWDASDSYPSLLQGVRVDTAGQVLDAMPRTFITTLSLYSGRVGLAFNGTSYVLLWIDGRNYSGSTYDDVYAARVLPDGTLLDPGGILISAAPSSQDAPAIAANSTQALLAWQSVTTSGGEVPDILGRRLLAEGTSPDAAPLLLSADYNDQSSVAVAFDGTNYLVVWTESRTGGDSILFTLVTPSGQVLNPAGTRLDTPVAGGWTPSHPDVAFNGSHYLVIWSGSAPPCTSYWCVMGARVRPDGTVIDVPERVLASFNYSTRTPKVASDGTDFLVVFTDSRTPTYNWDIYGARILSDGSRASTTDIPIAVSTAYHEQDPAVGFDGQRYVVAWADARTGLGSGSIYARGVARDGTPLPEFYLGTYGEYPKAGSNGQSVLVAWEAFGSGGYDVTGRLVFPDGGVGPSSSIATGTGWQRAPGIAFNGSKYLVVFESYNGPATGNDLYFNTVRLDGTVTARAAGGSPLSTLPHHEMGPAVGCHGDGGCLVVYARADKPDGSFEPAHAKFRLFQENELGEPCTGDEDCKTGFCADGVCCDSACGPGFGDCQACNVDAGATLNGHCTVLSPATVCREAISACDFAERCDGVSTDCPSDAVADAGTPCNDYNACTTVDACQDGWCIGSSPVICTPLDECHWAGYCDYLSGSCSNPPIWDGSPCDGGTCQRGICTPPYDAGTPADAGFDGGSEEDAGTSADAGSDGGSEDGGGTWTDAGTSTDAGWDGGAMADAGISADAGAEADAGSPSDAGGGADAGPGGGDEKPGCGCNLQPANALLGWALLAVALRLHRRPRRNPRGA